MRGAARRQASVFCPAIIYNSTDDKDIFLTFKPTSYLKVVRPAHYPSEAVSSPLLEESQNSNCRRDEGLKQGSI